LYRLEQVTTVKTILEEYLIVVIVFCAIVFVMVLNLLQVRLK